MWLHQGYLSGDLKQLVDAAVNRQAEIRLIPVSVAAAAMLLFLVWWATARRAVYLVDFTVWTAPEHLRLTKERFEQGSRDCGVRTCLKPLRMLQISEDGSVCSEEHATAQL